MNNREQREIGEQIKSYAQLLKTVADRVDEGKISFDDTSILYKVSGQMRETSRELKYGNYEIDDPIPLDRGDIYGLYSIAEWFSSFPNDDYKGDALFIEDVVAKVAPLVREVENLNMELTKQRSIYRELLAGFEQLKKEREL